jgi:toxin ParE1/3/4
MVYNIIISSDAYLDMNETSDWYDNQLKGLGVDFVLEFYEEANYLSENAMAHVFLIEPVRKKLMKKFPYAIYYSIIHHRNEVLIEAVWHQKRSPDRLRVRLKK